MKLYSIFDDYGEEPAKVIREAGIELDIHPLGQPRPTEEEMGVILKEYEGVILGTSQKITEEMFDGIDTPRIIATASVGLDHIHVPEAKKEQVTILNTPKANANAVAEYTFAQILSAEKRLTEGNRLYREGKNNKSLHAKPVELAGKLLGVIGAGEISRRIMQFGSFFGMKILCWTRTPENHRDMEELGVRFVSMEELLEAADVISVNLPNNRDTQQIISKERIGKMKDSAIFVSVSRLALVDTDALLEKARTNPGFYACLDVDVDTALSDKVRDMENVSVTPHVAGGTTETRKRMFMELAGQIADIVKEGGN